MKHQKLIALLIASEDPAADALLLEGLRIGSENEQSVILDAILRRKTQAGLLGVLGAYETLAPSLRDRILSQPARFYSVLSDAGRSSNRAARLTAMKLIGAARLGKLSYVLSENLRDPDDELSAAACEAMSELAKWVHDESRRLHRANVGDALTMLGHHSKSNDSTVMAAPTAATELQAAYDAVMKQRPEIENSIARSLDFVKTKHAPDLLRAALSLCDHPQSKILAILKVTRHGGQMSMLRRLQQSPTAEHVEAFLLGGSHGHLRAGFITAYGQIEDAQVLSALLRHSHWLGDHHLRMCLDTATRGPWLDEAALPMELQQRSVEEAAGAAGWVAASGLSPAVQDARLQQILKHVHADPVARLRVLRQAVNRKEGGACVLAKQMIGDTDERLARIAARELIRRRPDEYQSVLLQQLNRAQPAVRRVISRAVSQAGFDSYWKRFEQMDKSVRQQAGRAMLKLLPDAPTRLGRYLSHGSADHRVRALQIVHELGLAERFRETLQGLCGNTNSRVRSKAVGVLITLSQEATGPLLHRALNDADARVRANAVEALEVSRSAEFVPMLTERARSAHNRERANAIKALHRMRVSTASEQLRAMLRDPRDEHRISAIWTLRHTGLWALIAEVGAIAQRDDSVRVRRYATTMLKSVIDAAQPKPAVAKVA